MMGTEPSPPGTPHFQEASGRGELHPQGGPRGPALHTPKTPKLERHIHELLGSDIWEAWGCLWGEQATQEASSHVPGGSQDILGGARAQAGISMQGSGGSVQSVEGRGASRGGRDQV